MDMNKLLGNAMGNAIGDMAEDKVKGLFNKNDGEEENKEKGEGGFGLGDVLNVVSPKEDKGLDFGNVLKAVGGSSNDSGGGLGDMVGNVLGGILK